jgi:hypothetical protein
MIVIGIRMHHVLRILKICGTFASTWPPDSTTKKREIFLRNLSWIVAIINVSISVPPLIFCACYSGKDIIRMMKALSELTALMEVLFNLILCKMEQLRLQVRLCCLKYLL